MSIDARPLTQIVGHDSPLPVHSAIYTMQVLMNEDNPHLTEKEAIEVFEIEMQRALDAGFFADLRYNFMQFEVVSRIVVFTEPGTED